MNRFCLFLGAAAVIGLMTASSVPAADSSDGSMEALTAFLHDNRLPLVEARMVTNDRGERSLMLYGFVATDYGKRDAEDEARDFMDDPDFPVINRIKVKPELLTLGKPDGSDPGTDAQAEGGLDDDAAQAAVETQDFPDAIGSPQEYADQERDDELLMSNGATMGGVPLALVLLGSGSIFPPIISSPIYSPFSPAYIHPPMVIYPPRPVYVYRTFPMRPYGGFPTSPIAGPFPSAFPAGPAPRFPATGGISPFATMNHGFGGFHSSFGGFGGFHGGFGGGGGFGGHR
jgi:hypothetical protein